MIRAGHIQVVELIINTDFHANISIGKFLIFFIYDDKRKMLKIFSILQKKLNLIMKHEIYSK